MPKEQCGQAAQAPAMPRTCSIRDVGTPDPQCGRARRGMNVTVSHNMVTGHILTLVSFGHRRWVFFLERQAQKC
jgi:hypothetical protein